jgi:hypothetical protein
VTAQARALSDRAILLLGAVFKADQDSLVATLERAGARRVTSVAWRTDHFVFRPARRPRTNRRRLAPVFVCALAEHNRSCAVE